LSYGFIFLDEEGNNKKNTFKMPLSLDQDDHSFDVKKEVFLYGKESK